MTGAGAPGRRAYGARPAHARATRTYRGARLLAAVLLLACAVLAPHVHAANLPERIEWAVAAFPPVFLFDESRPPASAAELGPGLGDTYLREIIRRLPGVKHEFVHMPFARTWAEMERGRDVCIPLIVRASERSQLAWYTPMSPPPPLTVVVRADRARDVLGDASIVSLAALLARPELNGVVPAARSYGDEVNALLRKPEVQGRVERIRYNAGQQAGTMLMLGRADYWLEWPHVAEWQVRGMPRRPPVTWRPILEFSVGQSLYIACTRSPAGRKAIEAIDAAIRQASRDETYRNAALNWYPAEIREAVTPRFKRFFDERSKQSLIE
jgi:uncharacterized protein (TIGR02285 family)